MQSGNDPEYATGKTKRNGTGRPGTKQANPVRKQETRTGTRTKRTRDCRYGTQLEPANQERNRQTRNATGKPGTEHNWNRQTRNATGAKHD